MHYYQFNISDYESHTKHLTEMEDLAYRRMLDWCYLHESPLPESIEEIAKKICMRTHSDCIANVLHEFFQLTESGYIQGRIEKEVAAYHAKSEKAKASAKARWSKKPSKNNKKANDANALQTYSERNAKHKTLNNKHKTINSANKVVGGYAGGCGSRFIANMAARPSSSQESNALIIFLWLETTPFGWPVEPEV